MKKKVLIVSPNPLDANSFWRCMGPMGYMAKHSGGEIEIQTSQPRGVCWADMATIDAVFFHRPCRPDDLITMQVAQLAGVPTWVDFDDWLFQLPGWNPVQKMYHSPALQNVMARILACADVVSTTTEQLAALFRPINPNTFILPNAYRSDMFKYRKDTPSPRQEHLAFWRGSNTHDGDILSVRDGFIESFREAKNHFCDFIGNPTWMLLTAMDPKGFKITPHQDVVIFNQHIYNMAPKVCVVPLVDCLFNRAKSNICFQEAVHAGAICVAPDMPEWRQEGVITYKPHDSRSFSDSIDQAFSMTQGDHANAVSSAFQAMKAKYDIKVVNEKRVNLLNHITDPNFKLTEHSAFNEAYGIKTLAFIQNQIIIPSGTFDASKDYFYPTIQ